MSYFKMIILVTAVFFGDKIVWQPGVDYKTLSVSIKIFSIFKKSSFSSRSIT
jgi:hypothetical protein